MAASRSCRQNRYNRTYITFSGLDDNRLQYQLFGKDMRNYLTMTLGNMYCAVQQATSFNFIFLEYFGGVTTPLIIRMMCNRMSNHNYQNRAIQSSNNILLEWGYIPLTE